MKKFPSRLLLTCLCLCAQWFLVSCGDGEPKNGKNGDAPPAPEIPPDAKIGDGVGAHGVSLETQAEQQIKEMIANGADPQKPHRIEYHLRADSLETAQAIVSWGEENGFETTPVDEENVVRGEWIYVDLVKNSKLELSTIWYDASRASDLAESLNCEYDGWGTPELVK